MASFQWNKKREEAAIYLAEDRFTDQEIADRLKVSRWTLAQWKNVPEFKGRVIEHVEAFRAATLKLGIAQRERRVAAQHDRWLKMQRVIDERGTAEGMATVPGGTTGLLVLSPRGDYEVDTPLLKEIREHEKQAAQELGQWAEKQILSGGTDGQPIFIKMLGQVPGKPEESPSLDDL